MGGLTLTRQFFSAGDCTGNVEHSENFTTTACTDGDEKMMAACSSPVCDGSACSSTLDLVRNSDGNVPDNNGNSGSGSAAAVVPSGTLALLAAAAVITLSM